MRISTLLRHLTLALALFVALATPAPVKAASGPVVILVDGFGDCCTRRMTTLIDGLKAMGAEFPALARRGLDGSKYSHYVVPWNSFSDLDQGFQVNMDPMSYVTDAATSGGLSGLASGATALGGGDLSGDQGLIDKVMGTVRRGSDSKFIDEVKDYLNALPGDRPVILIGHSFGGDSIMEAAKKTGHEILFLGALDPVGGGGLRRLDRSREVPSNVKYFYTRWQNNGLFPFDYVSNGEFKKCHASMKCDQGKLKTASGGGELGHVEFPSDANLQSEILDIIHGLLKGGSGASASSDSGSSSGTSLKDQLIQQSPLKGMFGK